MLLDGRSITAPATSEPADQTQTKTPGELPPGTHVRTRVLRALRDTGRSELAKLYGNCCKQKRCRLVHCKKCRNRWSDSHRRRVIATKKAWYGSDDQAAKNCMKHVTVLNALVPCDQKAIQAAIDRGRADLQSFTKKFTKTPIRGAFEIELVSPPAMIREKVCLEKIRTLNEMTGGAFNTMTETMVLVHWHSIFFLNGSEGPNFPKWMQRHYPHHRQMKIDSFYKNTSTEDSIRKLCSYPFKDRVTFNFEFRTKGFENEKYFDSKDLGFLAATYHSIGCKGIMINYR